MMGPLRRLARLASPAPARRAGLLVPAVLALGLAMLGPGRALAQGCAAPPLANAGNDEQRCTQTFGSTEVPLSGAFSQPNVLNGPIILFCWDTDVGVFDSTGTSSACSDRPGVTLSIPNRAGRTVAHVQLTVIDFSGCTDTDDVLVTLETPPVILVATTSQPTACTFQPIELIGRAADTFNATGLLRYEWDRNIAFDSDLDGSPINDADAVVVGVSGATTAVTVTPTEPGTFTARLNVVGENSACIASALVTFQRDETPAIGVLRAESLSSCPGAPSLFHAELATTSPPATLTWDFDTSVDSDGNGVASDDDQASGSDVEWVFPSGGPTTLRVRAIAGSGCVGTRDLTVDVRPGAVASFTTEGPGCGVLALTLRDTSTGTAPITASWDFGDGSPIEQGSVRTHVYSIPGTYLVRLTVTDGNGCPARTERSISVTPNGLEVVQVQVQDGQPGTSTIGNANGFADPGERVRLVVTVRNSSGSVASNAQVALRLASSSFGADILDDTALLPTLLPGQSSTTFAPHLGLQLDDSAPCGSSIGLELIASGQLDTSCQTSHPFALRIGAPEALPLGDEVRITTQPGPEEHPALATAGDVHAVVFEDEQAPPRRILMRRLGSIGTFIDDARQVSTLGAEARLPRVAWNPAAREFAVIWIETAGLEQRLMMQRVDQGGTLVGARARVDMLGHVTSADIVWSGSSWIVPFVDAPLQGTPLAYAQRLTSEGFLLGAPARIDAAGASHAFVRAAAGPSGWAAAILRGTGEALVELRPAGSAGSPSASVNLGAAEFEPFPVAASGADFVAALSSAGQVDAIRVSAAGALARERAGDGASPAIAAGADAAFVAWVSGGDLLVRPASTSGEVTSSAALLTPLAGAASQPVMSVASDGLFFLAWADERPANPDDPDVYARVLQEGASAGCGTVGVLGDIAPQPDGNLTVDVGDVVLALRVSVGLEPATPSILARGDVAPGLRSGTVHHVVGDGVIDVGDVVVLLQASVGQISLQP